MTGNSHLSLQQALRTRIEAGEWPPGALMPKEADLAAFYGCARSTVNRALQAIAEDGLIERKRKGGTRILPTPVRQAKFEIPVLRKQIEASGAAYRHHILSKRLSAPKTPIRTRLNLSSDDKVFHVETVHLGDDRPFAFEERWVNIAAAPDIVKAPLDEISANEWLVRTIPYSSGDVLFSAVNANKKVAAALETDEGAAIFTIDRTTWINDQFITTMKLYFRQGYHMYSKL